ncbi:MAG: hypothetical protein ACFBSF_10545 [Leptolyngbyaceae cyanobacterium]
MKSSGKGYQALKGFICRCAKRSDAEGGLTLLEALMAIIVIGLAVSAITPSFVLALATRVQSQRAEQAAQLAQDQIDEARLIMELDSVEDPDDPGTVDREDFLPVDTGDTGDTALREVDAPTIFLDVEDGSCSPVIQPAETQACLVDVDGDDEDDFAVQAYRVNSYTSPNGLAAFEMGVRVYHVAAEANLGSLSTDRTTVGLSSGPRGDSDRGYRIAPLSVVYTTIVRSEAENALCDYFAQQGLDEAELVNKGLTCDT